MSFIFDMEMYKKNITHVDDDLLDDPEKTGQTGYGMLTSLGIILIIVIYLRNVRNTMLKRNLDRQQNNVYRIDTGNVQDLTPNASAVIDDKIKIADDVRQLDDNDTQQTDIEAQPVSELNIQIL